MNNEANLILYSLIIQSLKNILTFVISMKKNTLFVGFYFYIIFPNEIKMFYVINFMIESNFFYFLIKVMFI